MSVLTDLSEPTGKKTERLKVNWQDQTENCNLCLVMLISLMIKKMGISQLRFFLIGYTVAIVTCYARKTTTTCLEMIGYLCDTISRLRVIILIFGNCLKQKF